MLVWLGDFNYRVDAEYGEAKGLVRRGDLSPLLAKVPLSTCCIRCSVLPAITLLESNVKVAIVLGHKARALAEHPSGLSRPCALISDRKTACHHRVCI